MARTSTVKLPPLNLAEAPKPSTLRSRGRSNSIVKVEHVGDRVEEVLDRNVYMNINADWVNAKGASLAMAFNVSGLNGLCNRCLANPCRAHPMWQNLHRHHPGDDPADKLDSGQSHVPRSALSTTHSCSRAPNLTTSLACRCRT
jgi:hypothetical protein